MFHQLETHQLSLVADALLRFFLAPLVQSHHRLEDLKGRDPGEILDSRLAEIMHPKANELMRLRGTAFVEGTTSGLREPFLVTLTTPFSRFIGQLHIEHKVEEFREGWMPPSVRWQDLGRIAPVELQGIRVGVNIFRPEGAFTGAGPVIREYLLCDVSSTQFYLELVSEGLKKKNEIPTSRTGGAGGRTLFSSIAQSLEQVLGVNLESAYETSLRRESFRSG